MKDGWVKLSKRISTAEEVGEKVLICRCVNKSQLSQARSIHDTRLLKFCNRDETWWMPLPDLPTEYATN